MLCDVVIRRRNSQNPLPASPSPRKSLVGGMGLSAAFARHVFSPDCPGHTSALLYVYKRRLVLLPRPCLPLPSRPMFGASGSHHSLAFWSYSTSMRGGRDDLYRDPPALLGMKTFSYRGERIIIELLSLLFIPQKKICKPASWAEC